MRTWVKVLICITLSFMFLFACVGYAALSDTLYISGSAETSFPQGIYIIATEVWSENLGTSVEAQELLYTSTVDSTVNLRYSTSGWRTTYGKVIYEFTVYNNTPYKYAYSGYDYVSSLDGYNGNAYIGNGLTVTVTDTNDGTFTDDTIAPGAQAKFRATYTITKRSLANTDLHTLINYNLA